MDDSQVPGSRCNGRKEAMTDKQLIRLCRSFRYGLIGRREGNMMCRFGFTKTKAMRESE
jgi:hypothetical protein